MSDRLRLDYLTGSRRLLRLNEFCSVLESKLPGLSQLLLDLSVVRRHLANVVAAFFRNLVPNPPDFTYFVTWHLTHPR